MKHRLVKWIQTHNLPAQNSFEPKQHPKNEPFGEGVLYNDVAYGNEYPNSYMDIYRCGKDEEKHPLIFYVHGGGFVSPFSNLYNKTALHFSQIGGNADVFSIDYRTTPESVFPAALMDAVDGYHWLLEQGYAAEKITLCGESAGGGLCLALTLWLRDHGEPLPGALVLSSPWADMTASGRSYQTRKTEDAFFGHPDPAKVPQYPVPILYAGQHDLQDPYLSPVFGDYRGFPPMLIQTGEAELLLSDSETVVKRAREAGAKVDYYTYPGMYHTFYIINPSFRESKAAWQRIQQWLNRTKV